MESENIIILLSLIKPYSILNRKFTMIYKKSVKNCSVTKDYSPLILTAFHRFFDEFYNIKV